MSANEIEMAQRNVVVARARLDSTLGALQLRLKPANLANDAWTGVKDKGENLADSALETVRNRPGAASLAVGAFALFLARKPLARAVSRMWSEDEKEQGVITTLVTADDEQYRASAPNVVATVNEGVI